MKVLLLAGTREARAIAQWLHDAGIASVASFAGVTRAPELPAIETRIGGFGGRAGMAAYLAQAGITHILDATHPFATQISQRAASLARERGLKHLLVLRPPWRAGAGDRWIPIAREEEAAAHIAPGARVFLATGRQTLPRFANLSACHLICRQIDPPSGPFPFSFGEYLVARPPFSTAHEIALFKRLAVDWLVVKNAGGKMSATKLEAARALQMPVLMVERPSPPEAVKAQSVEEAIAWLTSQSA
ncbi:MAG: cobalt-precorrin-6A reductase [Pseudomonadota bacterium]